jgi:hypothetical protein
MLRMGYEPTVNALDVRPLSSICARYTLLSLPDLPAHLVTNILLFNSKPTSHCFNNGPV